MNARHQSGADLLFLGCTFVRQVDSKCSADSEIEGMMFWDEEDIDVGAGEG